MRPAAQAIWAVTLTFVVLAGLLVWDPIGWVRDSLEKTGTAQADARVTSYFVDPETQEASNGQHPLASLRRLESAWCGSRAERRYIISGNSQTLTVVLAPSESPGSEPARTYPDYLMERLKASGFQGQGYRLSAPNLSYA
jgi:hypothetical protein